MLIGRLQALSGSPESNRSEIEKLVGAASRTFMVSETYDFPGEALGAHSAPHAPSTAPRGEGASRAHARARPAPTAQATR